MTTPPDDVASDLVEVLTRAVVLVERCTDPDPILLADLFAGLARLERARERPGPGIAWAEGALATREAALGADDPAVARDLGELGELYQLAGRPVEAAAARRRARAVLGDPQEV